MNGGKDGRILFSESEISARVTETASAIAKLTDPPELAVPILVGGFVFAADLLRALDRNGLSLAVEFIRLRSYGKARIAGSGIDVTMAPDENVRGRHVLLVDGVLDRGHTLGMARKLILAAGARAVTTAVVIDKMRDGALLISDFAAFRHVAQFVAGYGMDDAGRFRSLPHIVAVN